MTHPLSKSLRDLADKLDKRGEKFTFSDMEDLAGVVGGTVGEDEEGQLVIHTGHREGLDGIMEEFDLDESEEK